MDIYPEPVEDEDGLEKEQENDGDIPGTGEDEDYAIQQDLSDTPVSQRYTDRY